jgi:hypothetical protein
VYWLTQVVHTLLDDGVQSLMYSAKLHIDTPAQAVQVVAPEVSEKLDPVTQPEHSVEPFADEYVPALQFRQLDCAFPPSTALYVPALQSWHVEDPRDTENFPATQKTHVPGVVASKAEEDVPGAQSEHVVAADIPALNLPAGHCAQKPSVTADGTVDRNRPAAQFMTVCAIGGSLPSGQ